MTVAEAITALQRLDPKAVLVIGDVLVQGIEGPVNGRVRDDYGAQHFTAVEKGRERAVFFTRWREMSDGTGCQHRI